MKRRWLKCWSENLRETKDEWLLLHQDGDYEYRNPDSVYVHRWETFPSRERALDWLDRCVAKVDQRDWRLYRTDNTLDPDLGGDYAAEWKDGEPPNQP